MNHYTIKYTKTILYYILPLALAIWMSSEVVPSSFFNDLKNEINIATSAVHDLVDTESSGEIEDYPALLTVYAWDPVGEGLSGAGHISCCINNPEYTDGDNPTSYVSLYPKENRNYPDGPADDNTYLHRNYNHMYCLRVSEYRRQENKYRHAWEIAEGFRKNQNTWTYGKLMTSRWYRGDLYEPRIQEAWNECNVCSTAVARVLSALGLHQYGEYETCEVKFIPQCRDGPRWLPLPDTTRTVTSYAHIRWPKDMIRILDEDLDFIKSAIPGVRLVSVQSP